MVDGEDGGGFEGLQAEVGWPVLQESADGAGEGVFGEELLVVLLALCGDGEGAEEAVANEVEVAAGGSDLHQVFAFRDFSFAAGLAEALPSRVGEGGVLGHGVAQELEFRGTHGGNCISLPTKGTDCH